MNQLEVLRDFNGWNWNTGVSEIRDITVNYIYQDFMYLLGIDFLKEWIHTQEFKDYLAIAKEKIEIEYGTKNKEEIFKWIDRLCLILLR